MMNDIVAGQESMITPAGAEMPAKPKAKKPHAKPKAFEWLNDLNQQVRGETALWVAVITQAMMDALSRAKNSEAMYHKHEAIRWLTGNSRDFMTVCHHAGLDPDYVRRKAKKSLAAPSRWRAEAGKGKRYFERKAYRKRRKGHHPVVPADSAMERTPEKVPEKVIMGPWVHQPNPAWQACHSI